MGTSQPQSMPFGDDPVRFSKVQYLAAAFELFAGYNMIFSPDALLGGYKPSPGYETLAFEWFGCACVCFGLSLLLTGSAMKLANLIYQLVWFVSLGSTFLGKPWRPESAVSDGSWALVPLAAHGVFCIAALLALALERQVPAKEKGY